MPLALQVETEENEESGEPGIVVKLWRADMLGGTMEFNSTCGIVKVDLQTMLLFGMPQQQLQQSGLCRCVSDPPALAPGAHGPAAKCMKPSMQCDSNSAKAWLCVVIVAAVGQLLL
jgi:hypothetical protein